MSEKITAKEHNEQIRKIPEEVKKIKLLGRNVLIRLFMLEEVTDSGIITVSMDSYIDERTHKKKTKSKDLPNYSPRGVVVSVGHGCSDDFKKLVKPGTIVDISPNVPLNSQQRWIKKEKINEPFEHYFIISEPHIEWISEE